MHDWTTPRTAASSSPPASGPSALTSFLQNINSLQLSSISATLNGVAEVLAKNDEATNYFLRKHLNSNPPDSRTYIDKPDIAVIKVRISSARVADLDDRVEKWRGEGELDTPIAAVNGLQEHVIEDDGI